MKKLIYTIILAGFSCWSFAQNFANPIFSKSDKLHIKPTEGEICIYNHKMEQGHTLYSLSKIFQLTVDEILRFNGITDAASIQLDQELLIPIKKSFISTQVSNINPATCLPIYYQVKPKDNMFRISKVYFDQSIENMRTRNSLPDNNIHPGQNLLVGWWPLQTEIATSFHQEDKPTQIIPADRDEFEEDFEVLNERDMAVTDSILLLNSSDTLMKSNVPVGFDFLLGDVEYNENMEIIQVSRVAYWDKSIPMNGSIFVLHKEAKLGTFVELFNPLLRRSVRAKVIGRIPYGTYTEDVELIVSPGTAKQLGALDKRFNVKVKYIK